MSAIQQLLAGQAVAAVAPAGPTLISAVVVVGDRQRVQLTFSEALNSQGAGSVYGNMLITNASFPITRNGSVETPSGPTVSFNGSYAIVAPSGDGTGAVHGDVLTISYIVPGSNALASAATGNLVAAFTNIPVTNNL